MRCRPRLGGAQAPAARRPPPSQQETSKCTLDQPPAPQPPQVPGRSYPPRRPAARQGRREDLVTALLLGVEAALPDLAPDKKTRRRLRLALYLAVPILAGDHRNSPPAHPPRPTPTARTPRTTTSGTKLPVAIALAGASLAAGPPLRRVLDTLSGHDSGSKSAPTTSAPEHQPTHPGRPPPRGRKHRTARLVS